jgi:hypothetical protein
VQGKSFFAHSVFKWTNVSCMNEWASLWQLHPSCFWSCPPSPWPFPPSPVPLPSP